MKSRRGPAPISHLRRDHVRLLGFVRVLLRIGAVLPCYAALVGAAGVPDLRDVFGGPAYNEACADMARRLSSLGRELAEVERRAEPLRRQLQSGRTRERGELRNRMEALGVTEHDLCAARHHIPHVRRERFVGFLAAEAAA